MPRFCSASGCVNGSSKLENRIYVKENNVTFHSFPMKDETRLQVWLDRIGRKDFQPTVHSCLCSEHFNDEDFTFQPFTYNRRLKPTAIPSKFCRKDKKPKQSYTHVRHDKQQVPTEQVIAPVPSKDTLWLCAAVNCNNTESTRPDLRFHRFPLDPEIHKLWIMNCGRTDLEGKSVRTVYRSNVLCCEHFEPACFQFGGGLKKDAVPTIFNISDPLRKQVSMVTSQENYSDTERAFGRAGVAAQSFSVHESHKVMEKVLRKNIPDKLCLTRGIFGLGSATKALRQTERDTKHSMAAVNSSQSIPDEESDISPSGVRVKGEPEDTPESSVQQPDITKCICVQCRAAFSSLLLLAEHVNTHHKREYLQYEDSEKCAEVAEQKGTLVFSLPKESLTSCTVTCRSHDGFGTSVHIERAEDAAEEQGLSGYESHNRKSLQRETTNQPEQKKKKYGNSNVGDEVGGRLKRDAEKVKAALQDVGAGRLSLRRAAKAYGIPPTVSHDKKNGKTPMQYVKKAALTKDEEQKFVDWLLESSNRGFGTDEDQLCQAVKNAVSKHRRTPFKESLPGRKWIQRSMKRRKTVLSWRKMKTQTLSSQHTCQLENKVRAWFSEAEKAIKEIDPSIFEDPQRIFSCEEMGYPLCLNTGKVTDNSHQQISVLVCGSADGVMMSPLAVFPGKDMQSNPLEGFREASYGHSENGWIDSDLFERWFEKDLIPFVKHLPKPILLFADGHKTHMSLRVSELCSDNNIIFYSLPSHSSLFSQPQALTVFRSLKENIRTSLLSLQERNARTLSREDFASVLKEAWCSDDILDLVRRGFRSAGLVPWNPAQIKFEKPALSRSFAVPVTQAAPATISTAPAIAALSTAPPTASALTAAAAKPPTTASKVAPPSVPTLTQLAAHTAAAASNTTTVIPTEIATAVSTANSLRPAPSTTPSDLGLSTHPGFSSPLERMWNITSPSTAPPPSSISLENAFIRLLNITATLGQDRLHQFRQMSDKDMDSSDTDYKLFKPLFRQIQAAVNSAAAVATSHLAPSHSSTTLDSLQHPPDLGSWGEEKGTRCPAPNRIGSNPPKIMEEPDQTKREDEEEKKKKQKHEEKRKIKEEKKERKMEEREQRREEIEDKKTQKEKEKCKTQEAARQEQEVKTEIIRRKRKRSSSSLISTPSSSESNMSIVFDDDDCND